MDFELKHKVTQEATEQFEAVSVTAHTQWATIKQADGSGLEIVSDDLQASIIIEDGRIRLKGPFTIKRRIPAPVEHTTTGPLNDIFNFVNNNTKTNDHV